MRSSLLLCLVLLLQPCYAFSQDAAGGTQPQAGPPGDTKKANAENESGSPGQPAAKKLTEEEGKLKSIDELIAPTLPALSILGVSPASIERPATPRAFAASVLSGIERSKGDFPSNYALAIAPYWWLKHSNLEFDDTYTGLKFWRAIPQTFSITAATTDIPSSDSVTKGTRGSLGLYFKLFTGE